MFSRSFQSTLPRRERRPDGGNQKALCDFNPRSREGSDGGYTRVNERGGISIHAPAKGATDYRRGARRLYRISIHAPAKGATLARSTSCAANVCYFNPRSREGSDFLDRTIFTKSSYFNPRSREGSDGYDAGAQFLMSKFQSTLPRRERPTLHFTRLRRRDFNPRSREGSDLSWTACGRFRHISIHAPAKGATSP